MRPIAIVVVAAAGLAFGSCNARQEGSSGERAAPLAERAKTDLARPNPADAARELDALRARRAALQRALEALDDDGPPPTAKDARDAVILHQADLRRQLAEVQREIDRRVPTKPRCPPGQPLC